MSFVGCVASLAVCFPYCSPSLAFFVYPPPRSVGRSQIVGTEIDGPRKKKIGQDGADGVEVSGRVASSRHWWSIELVRNISEKGGGRLKPSESVSRNCLENLFLNNSIGAKLFSWRQSDRSDFFGGGAGCLEQHFRWKVDRLAFSCTPAQTTKNNFNRIPSL